MKLFIYSLLELQFVIGSFVCFIYRIKSAKIAQQISLHLPMTVSGNGDIKISAKSISCTPGSRLAH